MNSSDDLPHTPSTRLDRKNIVVVGNGMVGQRFCERLVEFDVEQTISDSHVLRGIVRRTIA